MTDLVNTSPELQGYITSWQQYQTRIDEKKKELDDLLDRQSKHLKRIEHLMKRNQMTATTVLTPVGNYNIRFVERNANITLGYLEKTLADFFGQKGMMAIAKELFGYITKHRNRLSKLVVNRQTKTKKSSSQVFEGRDNKNF